MRVHALLGNERSVLVTGTTDSAVADPEVVAEIVDQEWFYERVWEAFPDASPETLRELSTVEAQKWVTDHPARLTAGRIVPDYGGDFSWLWMEKLRLDRPGAFFALVYDDRQLSPGAAIGESNHE